MTARDETSMPMVRLVSGSKLKDRSKRELRAMIRGLRVGADQLRGELECWKELHRQAEQRLADAEPKATIEAIDILDYVRWMAEREGSNTAKAALEVVLEQFDASTVRPVQESSAGNETDKPHGDTISKPHDGLSQQSMPNDSGMLNPTKPESGSDYDDEYFCEECEKQICNDADWWCDCGPRLLCRSCGMRLRPEGRTLHAAEEDKAEIERLRADNLELARLVAKFGVERDVAEAALGTVQRDRLDARTVSAAKHLREIFLKRLDGTTDDAPAVSRNALEDACDVFGEVLEFAAEQDGVPSTPMPPTPSHNCVNGEARRGWQEDCQTCLGLAKSNPEER